MRSYPRNSPQAAARLVTLAMLADGTLAPRELTLAERLGVHLQIGLSRVELQRVLRDFCEDLLSGSHLTWTDMCRIDPATLASMYAEIDDPALRRTVMALGIALVEADGEVVPAESLVIAGAAEAWGLAPEGIAPMSVSSTATTH